MKTYGEGTRVSYPGKRGPKDVILTGTVLGIPKFGKLELMHWRNIATDGEYKRSGVAHMVMMRNLTEIE